MESSVFQQRLNEHHIRRASDRKHETELKAFEKHKQAQARKRLPSDPSDSPSLAVQLFRKLVGQLTKDRKETKGYSRHFDVDPTDTQGLDNELD